MKTSNGILKIKTKRWSPNLVGGEEAGHVESLHGDLEHLFQVCLRRERRVAHHQRMLLWRHPQLVVERVVPVHTCYCFKKKKRIKKHHKEEEI